MIEAVEAVEAVEVSELSRPVEACRGLSRPVEACRGLSSCRTVELSSCRGVTGTCERVAVRQNGLSTRNVGDATSATSSMVSQAENSLSTPGWRPSSGQATTDNHGRLNTRNE